MTFSAGTPLGPYEILAPLGAGGMGEVYLAKDPRLGREVAVKVLPEALALDRDRLSRFEQEARAASALNHPNIVTIRYVVGFREGRAWVYPIDGGGEGRAVPGVVPGDRVIQWSADSRSVYVFSLQERPLRVFLLDLETGQKRLWKEIPLDESVGRVRVRITPDGRFYVYSQFILYSELYLVEGLR